MSSFKGVRTALRALAVSTLLLTLSAPAFAQENLLIDANIFWDNTTDYSPDSGGAACWHGTINTTQLATTVFANQTVNPFLTDAYNLGAPDWSPANGSPALPNNANHRVVKVWELDPWFDTVCYGGAADYGDRWWEGWTYYNYADGAGRTDIPAVAPIDVFSVAANATWTTGNVYRLNGRVDVQAGATLTIQAGVVVIGAGPGSYLVVERDGDIVVNGSATQPVIFTSGAAPGSQFPGDWGGVVIHGNAVANCAGVTGCGLTSVVGDCESEGGAGFFGGTDDFDSSGSIRYARVEYAGQEISPNNELNAWTMNAVGSGTSLEYMQAHLGTDDLFEWFGGTARLKHIVATGGDDDNLDWQMGFRGRVQFAVCQQAGDVIAPFADAGIEADNNEFDFNCPGRSNPILSNLTLVGSGPLPGGDEGINIRRGTAATIVNSIVQGWQAYGLEVDDAATWDNCAAQNTLADADCGAIITGVGDIDVRNPGIIVAAAPNPTRGPANISFSLEKAGNVKVQIFDVNGRLVQTLVDERMSAGAQSLRWESAGVSGMYFYSVATDTGRATGKLVVTR